MKTQAVRLHGAGMLSLDEFELPEMREDEILARIVSDSLCMSSYKAAIAGTKHKRVPPDIAERPVIIGHECSGEILAVGKRWEERYFPGQRFTMQVALNLPDTDYIPGYAYPYLGGDATYVLLPPELMECGCLLPYNGAGFFRASLSEPYSCVIGAFHASYHTEKGRYTHEMGVRVGGDLAILAGAGPMGLAATDYAVHGPRKPARVVVTDIDKARLARAAQILSPEDAKKAGVELIYLDTGEMPDAKAALLDFTGGKGYDDVFVFTPVASVAELGDAILGRGGCLNFFAGPAFFLGIPLEFAEYGVEDAVRRDAFSHHRLQRLFAEVVVILKQGIDMFLGDAIPHLACVQVVEALAVCVPATDIRMCKTSVIV